jgi:hypothetical protein
MDDTSAYYVWEVTGKPVRVRFSNEAMERVLNEAMRGLGLLPRRGAEVGGLLIGTVEPGEVATTRIEDIVPVPIEYAFGPFYAFSERDKKDFGETMRQWERSAERPLHAVGFYRSHMQDQLALGQHDLWLFSNYFRDASDVALLIRPRAMRASTAGFFIREQWQIRAEASYLEFPMRSQGRAARAVSQAEVTPPAQEAAPALPADVPVDVPLPSFLNVPPPEEGKRKWAWNWKWWKRAVEEQPAVEPIEIEQQPEQPERPRQPLWTSWWVQVPILAGLLMVDGLLGFVSARQFRPPAVCPAAAPRDPYTLSLMVVEYGDNLCLTWDRYAPAIVQAQKAVLSISDGDHNQTLDVELPALQSPGFGVTYHRMTDRVKFRLEVFMRSRRSVSETWELGANATSASEVGRPVR